MLGWRKKRAHAQPGRKTKKAVRMPALTQEELYGPVRQCSSFRTSVKQHSYKFESLISRRCFTHSGFIQDSDTTPPQPTLHIWTQMNGSPYSPPNIERHDVCTFNRGISGQSYTQRTTIQLGATLPVVHRYRADVSLGRFAQADWLRATSCSPWFYFLR